MHLGHSVALIPYCALKAPEKQYEWDSLVPTPRISDDGLKQNLGILVDFY